MDKKNYSIGDTEIENLKFYYQKNPISADDVDIDKILISNNISISYNYFIVYKVNEKAEPLCTIIPKMSAYTKR